MQNSNQEDGELVDGLRWGLPLAAILWGVIILAWCWGTM